MERVVACAVVLAGLTLAQISPEERLAKRADVSGVVRAFATKALLEEACGKREGQERNLAAFMAENAPRFAGAATQLYPEELNRQRPGVKALTCGTPQHAQRLKQQDSLIQLWKQTWASSPPELLGRNEAPPAPSPTTTAAPSIPAAPAQPRSTQPAEARQRVQDIARLHAEKAVTLEACSPGKAREVRAELEGLIKWRQPALAPAALEVFDEQAAAGSERLAATRQMCGSPLYTNRLMNDSRNVEEARRNYGASPTPAATPQDPSTGTARVQPHASDPRYRSFAPDLRRLIDEEADVIRRMCEGTPIDGPYDCSCYTRQMREARLQSNPVLAYGAPSPSGAAAASLVPHLADLARSANLAQCISKPLTLQWAHNKTTEALRLQPNLNAAAIGECTGERFYATFAAKPAPDGNYINHLFSEAQFECLAKLRRR